MTLGRLLAAASISSLVSFGASAQSLQDLNTAAKPNPMPVDSSAKVQAYLDSQGNKIPIDAQHPLPIAGAFSATPQLGATWGNTATTVGTTAIACAAPPGSGNWTSRVISDYGTADVFIGPAGVTAATGQKVSAGGSWDFSKFSGTLYCISSAAGQDVRAAQY